MTRAFATVPFVAAIALSASIAARAADQTRRRPLRPRRKARSRVPIPMSRKSPRKATRNTWPQAATAAMAVRVEAEWARR